MHPGVTQVLDHGVVPAGHEVLPVGSPWLALEYASGGTLDGFGPAEEHEVLRIAWLLLDALAYVHARGVVHLDVKASNVLVCRDEAGTIWPSLTDFGTLRGEGTRRYAAPEQQVRGGALGPWTDLYGLGCVLVRLLAGHLPEAPHAWLETDPSLSSSSRSWLERLLEPLAEDRFSCASEAAWALYAEHPFLPRGPCFSWREPGSSPRAPLPTSVARARWEQATAEGHQLGLGVVTHGGAAMVGRREEQARVWEALRAVEARQGPRMVLIGGAAGLGRSHFLQWVSWRVREYGRHGVIHVRAEEGQADRGTLWELEQQRAAVESGVFAPIWAHDPRREREGVRQVRAPGLDTSGRIRAFMSWAAAYSLDRPLVLIVDDVHHCPTLWPLIDEVLHRGMGSLCVVFSGRTASGGPCWVEARDRAHADARVSYLELGPLSSEDSRALLKGRLHLDEGEVLRHIAEAAGHPSRLVSSLKGRAARHGYVPGQSGYVSAE